MFEETQHPLSQPSQAAWNRLVSAANPPALLVAIRGFLGHRMRLGLEPEDVLQETLLQAWRDRLHCEWRGTGSFRRWLLQIARNRVCDLADQVATQKRGGGKVRRLADLDAGGDSASSPGEHYAGLLVSTTPSRVAADRETAADLEAALATVPEDWREVVRLRLFEDLEFEAIAHATGVGVEAVRYRFRHGAEAYRMALRRRRAIPGGES